MPADKRKAAPTTASPSSKKTKKATKEAPTLLRRSTRSTPTKATPPPVLEESKPAVAPKAKAAEKEKGKAKPAEKQTENKTEGKKAIPRKRAADFYSGDEGEESDGGWDKLHADEAKAGGKKGGAAKKAAAGKKDSGKQEKTVKKAKIDAAHSAEKEKVKMLEQEKKGKAIAKKSKKTKAPASDDEISLHSDSEPEVANILNGGGYGSEQDSADEEEDDQTATLLKGFESSDDDEEPEDVAIVAVKNRQFRNLTIPDVKQKIAARSNKKASGATPGYIYLGRIPHGFYEHEMRAYFSQFGTILRLRLSRNKKTGRSKHYAFIEFADSEAAAIVSETMDNYLLFGHILKCKVIPRSDIKDVEALFKGANKRFKPIPWGDVKQRQLEKKRTVEEWEKLEKREDKRRKEREKKLKSMGIDYEYEPVKQIEAVVPVVEELVVQAPKAIEAVAEVEAEKEEEAPKEDKKKGGRKKMKAKAEKLVAVKEVPAPKEKASTKAKAEKPIAEKPVKEARASKEKAATASKKIAKKTRGKK
ncbi:ribosomal biogenesis protein Gar2 [Tirmania nivea]|nr:ribosomal biogenesis protein Gar2 [Tirmania nivea]